MRRRDLLTALAALTAALAPCAGLAQDREHGGEQDAVAFVRRLYEGEIERDARGAKIGNAEFYGLFTREVGRLLRSPVPPRPDIALGPLSHAFYGPGVLPGTQVTLQQVAPAAGTSVAVDLMVRGEPRRVIVRTARENGQWRIADIDYGRGDSYVAYQRKLRGQ